VEDSIIVLKDASIYQNDFLVLNSVNLNIEPGEFVYLIGKTGSGKSSLLKTLYGELPLNLGEGTVMVLHWIPQNLEGYMLLEDL